MRMTRSRCARAAPAFGIVLAREAMLVPGGAVRLDHELLFEQESGTIRRPASTSVDQASASGRRAEIRRRFARCGSAQDPRHDGGERATAAPGTGAVESRET